MFEQDETLTRSDMTFVEEDDVAVDVSLFEHESGYEDTDEDEDEDDEGEEENYVLNTIRNAED